MGRHLGVGIAALLNVFNPEKLTLSGGLLSAWDFFQAEHVRRHRGEHHPLEPAGGGDTAAPRWEARPGRWAPPCWPRNSRLSCHREHTRARSGAIVLPGLTPRAKG